MRCEDDRGDGGKNQNESKKMIIKPPDICENPRLYFYCNRDRLTGGGNHLAEVFSVETKPKSVAG